MQPTEMNPNPAPLASGETAVNALSTVRSVVIEPAERGLPPGGQFTFFADVFGEHNPSQAVIWRVADESSIHATIDQKGLLTVANTARDKETITISATAVQDQSVSATARVTITMPELTLNAASWQNAAAQIDGRTTTLSQDYMKTIQDDAAKTEQIINAVQYVANVSFHYKTDAFYYTRLKPDGSYAAQTVGTYIINNDESIVTITYKAPDGNEAEKTERFRFAIDTADCAMTLTALDADSLSLGGPWYYASLQGETVTHLVAEPDAFYQNWMSRLPDDMDIRDMAIPGTHDSATVLTAIVPLLGPFTVTQATTIEMQLLEGIRYFDLRVGGDGITSVLTLWHGIIPCIVTLSAIMDTFKTFLSRHPRETILVGLQNENGILTEDEFRTKLCEQALEHPQYRQLWYRKNTAPLLRDVRGKLILLRGFLQPGDDYANWGINLRDSYQQAYVEYPTRGTWIKVQNLSNVGDTYYENNVSKKAACIVSLLTSAASEPNGNALYVNLWSHQFSVNLHLALGFIPYPLPRFPLNYADSIQDSLQWALISYFQERKTKGIQVFDFYRAKTVRSVIQSNMNSPVDCVENIESGKRYQLVNVHSGKAVTTINPERTTNGDGIHQWTIHRAANQTIIPKKVDEDTYELQFQHSGKLLCATKLVSGSSIVQWEDHALGRNEGRQRWTIRHMPVQSHPSTSPNIFNLCQGADTENPRYMDITGASQDNYAFVHMYAQNLERAQQFYFMADQSVDTIENGKAYYIASALSGLYLSTKDPANPGNSVGIHLWDPTDAGNQTVVFQQIAHEWWVLKMQYSNKLLCAVEPKDGYAIVQYQDHDAGRISGRQCWKPIYHGNGLFSFVQNSGRVMDVCGAGRHNGTAIQVYQANHTLAQRFKLYPANTTDVPVDGETYYIANIASGSCLTSAMFSIDYVGERLFLWKNQKALCQQITLIQAGANKWMMAYKYSNKVLSAQGKANASMVVQANRDSNNHLQYWDIIRNNNGSVTFKNCASGLILDVKGAGRGNGTPIWVYNNNNGIAQQFRLIKA